MAATLFELSWVLLVDVVLRHLNGMREGRRGGRRKDEDEGDGLSGRRLYRGGASYLYGLASKEIGRRGVYTISRVKLFSDTDELGVTDWARNQRDP